MRTFYLEPDAWNEPFALEGAEAHHLAKVVRARVGDRIRLIDGAGRVGTFVVRQMHKTRAALSLESEEIVAPPPSRCVLALGWNKSSRRGWLMEKLVELEGAGVWFWQAERSQGRVPAEPKESWRGRMVAGAKQCANPHLPELRTLSGGVDELIGAGASFQRRYLLWEGESPERVLAPDDVQRQGASLFVLGPEGGFAPGEVERLSAAGFEAVSLGRRILRWETAALLCLGLCWWGSHHASNHELQHGQHNQHGKNE